MKSCFFVFLLIFGALNVPCLSAQTTYVKESKGFDSEKAIAIEATIIAQTRLVKDDKDEIAHTLVKLANHLYPNYKPLLLLRAKLKYGLDITKPKSAGVGEEEFVAFLKRRSAKLKLHNNQRDRHLRLVYHSIIRLFDPEDEKSLISLMEFEDSGCDMDLEKLLNRKFSTMPSFELDPKDPRYAIGDVKKTIDVRADTPWTDSWIKVKAGKVVRVDAKRFWSLGSDGTFPYCDGDGFDNLSMQDMVDKGNVGRKDKGYRSRYRAPKFVSKKLKGKKDMNPGCLLAKIGSQIQPVGKKGAFRAEASGVLYFGPFEWDAYNDNNGYLSVTVEVSDK